MRRNGGGGGPSMKQPNIHDLDMEIQLLRHKREIIEQQQQMMSYDDVYERGYGYQQDQIHSGNNYGQMYDEPRYGSHVRGNRQDFGSGKKRPAPMVSPWESEDHLPPKRFYDTPRRTRTRQRKFTPLKSTTPLFKTPIKLNKQPPPPLMKTTKLHSPLKKPKPAPAPNKIKTYPINVRKSLVAEATKVADVDEQSLVLRSDKEPNKLMVGRLEFVLGNILKDIKEFYVDPKYSVAFQYLQNQRAMKQFLRERIREVMLGKAVINSDVILDAYRAKYTIESDIEVINKGLASAETKKPSNEDKNGTSKQNLKKETEKGKPSFAERYFYTNINRLIRKTLGDTFEKLRLIHESEDTQNGENIVDTTNVSQNADNASDSMVEALDDGVKASEDGVKASDDGVKASDEGVKAPDDGVKASDDAIKAADDAVNASNDVVNASDDVVNASDDDLPNTSKDADTANNSKLDDESKQSIEESVVDGDNPDETALNKMYDRLIENRIHNKLKYILPQFKEVIANMIDVNKMYQSTKIEIILKSEKIAEDIVSGRHTEESISNDNSISELFYVKVIGRPNLPKRALMQKFLDQFYPASIKKHKKVNNLLFIGVKRKEDMDNLLAADHTFIGKSTIAVKPSGNVPTKEEKDNKDDDVIFVADSDPSKGVIDIDNILNKDLDSQITNLLQTIRQNEESRDVSLEEPAGDADGTKDDAKVIEDESENNEDTVKEEEAGNAESNGTEFYHDVGEDVTEKKENDQVAALKKEVPGSSPATRSSARLATTPSAVKTRRSSKLAPQN